MPSRTLSVSGLSANLSMLVVSGSHCWWNFGASTASWMAAFEELRAAGKIRAWGISNFNVGQMEDLFSVPEGHRCATNQVPYSLNNRRVERAVLPWCTQ